MSAAAAVSAPAIALPAIRLHPDFSRGVLWVLASTYGPIKAGDRNHGRYQTTWIVGKAEGTYSRSALSIRGADDTSKGYSWDWLRTYEGAQIIPWHGPNGYEGETPEARKRYWLTCLDPMQEVAFVVDEFVDPRSNPR